MAYSQTDIAALERAIGLGATRVEFVSGDTKRVVEYRSLAEMQRILNDMRAAVTGYAVPRTVLTQRTRD